ncbi:MAG: AMP-binding protein [Pseudomonadales bacterium]
MSRFDFSDARINEMNEEGHANLIAIFDETVAKYADRIAFSALGKDLSFAELDQQSRALAGWLLNDGGLNEGDRVAVQLPNLSQYPIAAWAILRSGLVLVNTNPLYTAPELEHQFNDSGARAVIMLADFLPAAESVLPKTGIELVISTNVFDMFEAQPAPDVSLPAGVRHVTFPELVEQGKDLQIPMVQATMSDVAVLQYTGGTTGVAKGAMLTHGNVFAYTQQSQHLTEQSSYYHPDRTEVLIAPLPIYHVFGFSLYLMGNMVRGGKSVLIPNPRDLDGMMDVMAGETFTGFAAVNTMLVGMLQSPKFDAIDWSECMGTISGGAALVPEVAKEWVERTATPIYEGYGLSETTASLTVNSEQFNQLGTVGKPLIGIEVKLVNAEGLQVAQGEEGELWVRGPNVMRGYWQRPEATEESIDEEGFFKTGDVAVEQHDGFFKIVDRLKDMVLVSGFNVYPNEIENVVYEHPAIVEAAVVGKPDARTGESVCLFVKSTDASLTEADLKSFCAERLTGYKCPKQVIFLDDLPKSNVGKILRRELRDQVV